MNQIFYRDSNAHKLTIQNIMSKKHQVPNEWFYNDTKHQKALHELEFLRRQKGNCQTHWSNMCRKTNWARKVKYTLDAENYQCKN